MPRWECDIEGCGERFDRVEDVLVHQATDHERCECAVCGTTVPDGYFAIRHAVEEHTRAEYVRAYGASAAEVRRREEIKDAVEARADIEAAIERIDGNKRTRVS